MQAMACFPRGGPMRQRYFLNVLAVTATLSANSVANGKTTKVGCRLNGSARQITQIRPVAVAPTTWPSGKRKNSLVPHRRRSRFTRPSTMATSVNITNTGMASATTASRTEKTYVAPIAASAYSATSWGMACSRGRSLNSLCAGALSTHSIESATWRSSGQSGLYRYARGRSKPVWACSADRRASAGRETNGQLREDGPA